MARLRYSVSFYALVDFLAVFPYYLARLSPWVDQYDNYLRLLRLLRILKVSVVRPMKRWRLKGVGGGGDTRGHGWEEKRYYCIKTWYNNIVVFVVV